MGVPEIEDAGLILNFGYNGADSHPIVQRRIIRAKQKGAKIITVDPRVIEAARISDMHLRLKGGTNLALVNALCNVIYNEGLMDEEFIREKTNDFDEFVEVIKNYTPEYVSPICGISPEDIRKAARMYATIKPAMILYGMGVCQFGQAVDVVKGLANLGLMTGNFGKPSTGIGPVRGQNNVQGACDMGVLPNNYPGYQNVTNDEVRAKFEAAWGVPLSNKVGVPLTHVPRRILSDDPAEQIHAYYIFGEDPAQSDPDINEVREALEKCELVILQDIFMNRAGQYADVVLPSTSWGEHEGVYTCCDRGFQRFHKCIEPPAGVKTDWQIISEISTAMGYPMHYNNTQEIWDEMRALAPKFAGATYEKMEANGGIQWPCVSEDPSDLGTPYLHKGKFANPDGKGRFYATDWHPPQELTDPEFPTILNTGREVGHYSARTMSGNCRLLRSLEDEPGWVQVNPDDCMEYGLKHGDLIKLVSRRGWCMSRVNCTERTSPGAVYMTYQWWIGACNLLTNPNLDPIANTPEFKYCAVRIEPIKDQQWAEKYVVTEYRKLRESMGIDVSGEEARV